MRILKKGVNMSQISQNMIDAWKLAKEEEKKYQELRWQLEEQIFDRIKNEVLDTGTYNYGEMQVLITDKKEWDQNALQDIYEQFDKKELWPFEQQWKVNSAAFKALQEMHPQYAAILNPALTIKRNSPQFKIKEVK